MWILAYFTRDGGPATGLAPLVRVRDVETGVIVISGSSMLERGDGFYGYDFSAYNPQKDYAVICDSVTLSGVERYTYASSGEYSEVLDSIESTVGVVDIRTTLLRKIQTNRLELFDGDTDNWILYDDDETTPLLTFSVSDKNDGIIVQCPSTPSKRSGADGVSGVLSPDIYMRKSVYDPDDDGFVSAAENVSDGVYTSTASGVWNAVDLAHLPCILGTKCIDETNIADGLFVGYNATTDRLEYVYAASSGISGTIDHGALLGLTDDDHSQYILADGTRAFTSTVSGVTPTENAHLATKQYVDALIASASGTTDHSLLNNLDYASADHTGFQPAGDYITTAELTTTSGDIVSQFPTDFYSQAEITTISGDVVAQIPDVSDFITDAEVVTISGDIVGQIPSLSGYATEAYVTTVSGDIVFQFPTDFYSQAEVTTISGDILTYVSTTYIDNTEMTTISGDLVAQISGIANVVEDTTPELGGDLNTGAYTVSGTGTIITGDHGTATHAEVVNVIYGTGSAPTVSGGEYPIGTLYIRYSA